MQSLAHWRRELQPEHPQEEEDPKRGGESKEPGVKNHLRQPSSHPEVTLNDSEI